MSRPTKPKNVAVLTIGYHHYLMPIESAMKVMQLMQESIALDYDTHIGHTSKYLMGDKPNLSIEGITPSQLRKRPQDEPQRLIGG